MIGSNVLGINLLHNLKLLHFDFAAMKIPVDWIEFRSYMKNAQKFAIIHILAFILSKLDFERFQKSLQPLLVTYNRTIDIKLKNIFLHWIKQLPLTLNLTVLFSRFWSMPTGDTVFKFLHTISSYVLQKMCRFDSISYAMSSCSELLSITEVTISSFLATASSIYHTQSQSDYISKKLNNQIKERNTEENAAISERSACLQYIPDKSDSMDIDTLLKCLSEFQKNRWLHLNSLKKLVSASLERWASLRPIYMDFIAASSDPSSSTLNAEIFVSQSDTQQTTVLGDNYLINLVDLIENSSSLFQRMQKSFGQPPGYSSSGQLTPSMELNWCSRALSRAVQGLAISSSTCSTMSSMTTTLNTTAKITKSSQELPLTSVLVDVVEEDEELSTTLDTLISTLKALIEQEREDLRTSQITTSFQSRLSLIEEPSRLSISSVGVSSNQTESPSNIISLKNSTQSPKFIEPGKSMSKLTLEKTAFMRDLSPRPPIQTSFNVSLPSFDCSSTQNSFEKHPVHTFFDASFENRQCMPSKTSEGEYPVEIGNDSFLSHKRTPAKVLVEKNQNETSGNRYFSSPHSSSKIHQGNDSFDASFQRHLYSPSTEVNQSVKNGSTGDDDDSLGLLKDNISFMSCLMPSSPTTYDNDDNKEESPPL